MSVGTMDLFRLDGRVALVTGAGQGIGRAVAQALADAGARVAVADINDRGASRTSDAIREAGGDALAVHVDLRTPASIADMVDATVSRFGRLDILVNNAAINKRVPSAEAPYRDWRDVLDVNLDAVFLCCQAVFPHMVRAGGGNIVNLASISGVIVNKGVTQAAYCASKAGVLSLTRALAAEWARYNIRVNAVSPSYVVTPQIEDAFLKDTSMRMTVIESTPLGRFAEPHEIGPVVVFLASDASSFVTGHNLLVDGGYTLW